MMYEELDIEAEYEKLHGPVSRKMLFDEGEYESLRKQILVEPRASLSKYYMGSVFSEENVQSLRKRMMFRSLPFKDITIVPARVWALQERIRIAKLHGHHLYYIKKEKDGQIVSYAAGYHNGLIGDFYVLDHSFFLEELRKTWSTETDFWKFLRYERKDGFCFEKTTKKYESASKAAKCYLGDGASIKDWVDDNGASLAKDKTYREYVPEPPQEPQKQRQLDLPLAGRKDEKTEKRQEQTEGKGNTHQSRHLFRILLGACNAYGYFDKEDGIFYVCAGSMVDEGLSVSPKRQRFLDKACQKFDYGWKVIKDAKCINASAAARYVTGKEVDYTLWRDDNGKYLKDYYPNYFFIGGESEQKTTQTGNGKTASKQPTIRWGAHAFYLRTEIGESDVYDAKGYYDPNSGQFTLKEGSLLSLTTKAAKFDQSAVGRLRANIINENCTRERNGYRLLADETCKDPIYAASVVMGKTINGWNMWKDSKGFFLSVYTQ